MKTMTIDINTLIEEFETAWNTAEDNILRAAQALDAAVKLVGEKDAFEAFDERFHLGKYNLKLLAEIGSGKVDPRVWMLPVYMHGIRNMDTTDQFTFLNTKSVNIYKFATEKPATIDLGSINQSDWRVAFDKEKARLRSNEEQLAYIHAKKKEYADRKRLWKVGKNGVVIVNSGTFTKAELLEMIEALG